MKRFLWLESDSSIGGSYQNLDLVPWHLVLECLIFSMEGTVVLINLAIMVFVMTHEGFSWWDSPLLELFWRIIISIVGLPLYRFC